VPVGTCGKVAIIPWRAWFMFAKMSLGLTLGCLVLGTAGCGSVKEGRARPAAPVSANAARVTLHVPGMVKRLKLA
jgi:hypothetical protein